MSTEKRITEVKSERLEPERERQIFASKVTQLVWLLLGILEGMFALRVLLKLVAANPNSPIAALIYAFTGLFLVPFSGLTLSPSAGGMVLEVPTLFAMLIYGLLGWAVERLMWVILYRADNPSVEVTQTRTREDTTHHQEEPK